MKLNLVPKEALECFKKEVELNPDIIMGIILRDGVLVKESNLLPVSLNEIDTTSSFLWSSSKKGVIFWYLVDKGLYNNALKTNGKYEKFQ